MASVETYQLCCSLRPAILSYRPLLHPACIVDRSVGVRWYKKPRSQDRPLPSKLQDYRRMNHLPVNPNRRGPLIDRPDFSYLDGRPAPPCVGQLRRAAEQRCLMERVVSLLSEMRSLEERRKSDLLEAELEETRRQQCRFQQKGTETIDTV